MTLLDLFRLLRRYLVLVIALPVVCAVAMYMLPISSGGGTNGSLEVTARIIANSQVQTVAGLASSEANQMKSVYPSIAVTAKTETGTTAVVITATGIDVELAAKVANEVADNTIATAEELFTDTNDRDNMIAFAAQVEYAQPTQATASASSGGKMKYMLVGLLAGLFVAICIVVVIDMIRRPVKSVEGVQDVIELPVLEKLPVQDDGERLLANIRFASKNDDLKQVCVIPTSLYVGAQEVADVIEAAAKAEGADVQIIVCESFAHGMDAAYKARKADAVVLTVNQWSDSLKTLESAVAELQLAEANLVGAVLGREVKRK